MMKEWFFQIRDAATTWDFQIVALIPFLGFHAVAPHVKSMTFSLLCLLPRVIPGPQAFIDGPGVTRSTSVTVVKIRGPLPLPYTTALNSVAVAAINLGPLNDLKRCSFHVVRIDSRPNTGSPIFKNEGCLSMIKYHISPHDLLSIFSFLLTIAMFILAAIKKDGIAMLALSIISLQSSISGYCNWWRPEFLIERQRTDPELKPEILLRTRNDALVVVYCSRSVAHLFMRPRDDDVVRYRVNRKTALSLNALALCMLLVSILLLGNCQWEMQITIGSSYAFLTLLLIGIRTPASSPWYKSTKLWPFGTTFAHKINPELWGMEREPSYIRTLWYAIKETRSVDWLRSLEPITQNPMLWAWLGEAMNNLDSDSWPAVTEYAQLVEGRESVYNLPVETTDVEESGREASMEITPVPVSQW